MRVAQFGVVLNAVGCSVKCVLQVMGATGVCLAVFTTCHYEGVLKSILENTVTSNSRECIVPNPQECMQ